MSSSISRRDFLRLLTIAGTGWLVSCSPLRVPATSTVPPKAASSTLFTPGALVQTPQPTQVTPQPTPVIPANIRSYINTVIILLQENHSFDSLFAGYPGANGKAAPNICADTIKHAIPEGGTSISYYCTYTEEQIPGYWKLAQSFVLCDNYFSEVRGPSFPNYLMLTSAQSPIMQNPHAPYECPDYCLDLTSLPTRLDEKGLSWHDYGGLFANIQSLQGRKEISYRSLDGFYQDAAAGQLPNVTWIGAYLVGGTTASGHPPGNICDAENYAMGIINAAMSGPQWSNTLLILIWDEWGGFYEHVIPPVVERQANGKPFRYGFRVPCIVISPYARAGTVEHTRLSHVSTLKTIEEIFEIAPLTERDASANSLLSSLDFAQTPIAPFTLPESTCSS